MNKIVLFNPKVAPISRKKGVLPLALLSISSRLATEGYEILIFDGSLDAFDAERMKGALCFGISAMIGYQVSSALETAAKIRKHFPGAPIVWGGWHVSIQPEQTARNEYVDFALRGQGENAFYQLVKALERGAGFEEIAGLTYKKDGGVVSNLDAPLVDPNTLPPLPYHLIDMERYINPSEFGKRSVNYLSSVGCPHSCGFCAEQLVHRRRWLALSPQRVVDDLDRLKREYAVDSVLMNDSEFFINEQRTADICSGMIERGLRLKWGNVNGRADTLLRYSDRTWELMRASGLQCILVGAETGDESTLELIGKQASVAETIEFAKRAGEYGILIKFSLMIGLPDSNRRNTVENEFYATIDFINRMFDVNANNTFLLFLYTPFPGTPLFEKSVELGYHPPQSLEEWGGFTTGLNHLSTPWVDKKSASLVYQANFYFPFASGFVKRLIEPYPWYKKLFLAPAEIILRSVMKFRLRRKFFRFPVEYFILKNLLSLTHR